MKLCMKLSSRPHTCLVPLIILKLRYATQLDGMCTAPVPYTPRHTLIACFLLTEPRNLSWVPRRLPPCVTRRDMPNRLPDCAWRHACLHLRHGAPRPPGLGIRPRKWNHKPRRTMRRSAALQAWRWRNRGMTSPTGHPPPPSGCSWRSAHVGRGAAPPRYARHRCSPRLR